MRINFKEELDKESLLDHLVVHCLSHTEEVKEVAQEMHSDDGYLDITLSVNGRELDIEKFVEHWQSQVKRMINDEVKETLRGRFVDVNNMLYDLEQTIQDKIESSL